MNQNRRPSDGEVLFKLFLGTIVLAVFVIALLGFLRFIWGSDPPALFSLI